MHRPLCSLPLLLSTCHRLCMPMDCPRLSLSPCSLSALLYSRHILSPSYYLSHQNRLALSISTLSLSTPSPHGPWCADHEGAGSRAACCLYMQDGSICPYARINANAHAPYSFAWHWPASLQIHRQLTQTHLPFLSLVMPFAQPAWCIYGYLPAEDFVK